MSYSVEIYEDEHFHKSYEDIRNNLYILYLSDEIEEWCEKHVGNYDLDCEDYYMERNHHAVSMEFENEMDALAFEMEWIYMTIDIKDFTAYDLEANQDIPIEKIKWITGLKYLVDLNHGDFMEHAQFRDWCLENCSHKIAFVEKKNPPFVENQIVVYCYDAADATAVKLRWV